MDARSLLSIGVVLQGVKDGKIIGEFKATGVRPRFAERFKVSGYELPTNIFD